MARRGKTATGTQAWVGCVLGLVITPALFVGFARSRAANLNDPIVEARQAEAVAMTSELVIALDRFRARHLHFPDGNQGLHVLTPEFLAQIPSDPWGNPYVYRLNWHKPWPDVVSYGADGMQGGGGEAADISGRFGRYGTGPATSLRAEAALLLVVPLFGFLGGIRWQWASGLLAGSAAFCGLLLVVVLSEHLTLSTSLLLPIGVILCCLIGSVAVLHQLRGASPLALCAVIAAYYVLETLIAF